MGNVRRFADRRMPPPGIQGVVAATAAAGLAAAAGWTTATAAAAFLPLVGWLGLSLRSSAPVNRIPCGGCRSPDAVWRPRAATRLGPDHRPQSRFAGSGRYRVVYKPDQLTPLLLMRQVTVTKDPAQRPGPSEGRSSSAQRAGRCGRCRCFILDDDGGEVSTTPSTRFSRCVRRSRDGTGEPADRFIAGQRR
jgi:hypothetical protein